MICLNPSLRNIQMKRGGIEHPGRGIIRLTVDLKTGVATKATVIKSTGFRTLDSCAVASVQRWTWKPGKWKEIDLPIIFHIGKNMPLRCRKELLHCRRHDPSRTVSILRYGETSRPFEVRPRKDRRGVDLISDALPFGRLR